MPPSRKLNKIEYASFTYRMLASVIDTILSAILLAPLLKFIGNVFEIKKTGWDLRRQMGRIASS